MDLINMSPDKLYGTLANYAPKLFGFKAISSIATSNLEQPSATLSSYWLVSMQYFRPDFVYDELIVSVVETNRWRRGLIIIPPKYQSKSNSDYPLTQPIDIGGWKPPFVQTLKSFNLFPVTHPTQPRNSLNFSLVVDYLSQGGISGYINIRQRSIEDLQLPEIKSFWESLMETIDYIAKLYSNERLNSYLYSPIDHSKISMNN